MTVLSPSRYLCVPGFVVPVVGGLENVGTGGRVK